MQFEFDHSTGGFSFRHPSAPGMSIISTAAWVGFHNTRGKKDRVSLAGLQHSISEELISGVHGAGRQLVIHAVSTQKHMELTFRLNQYEQHPFILLRLTLRNLDKDPIYIDHICLCQADRRFGSKLDITAGEDLRFFKVGWHGWAYSGLRLPGDHNSRRLSDWLGKISYSNLATPRPYTSGEFWSEGWGILAGAEVALVAGFASTAHQFGQVYTRLKPADSSMQLILQLDGIQLDPGDFCDSEWGYLQFVPLPNAEPALDYVQAVARQVGARLPRTPPPPMWTHWYQFYEKITAKLFVENLDVLVSKRASIPIKVAELDDGYQSAWGDWTKTNQKFPTGLADLALKTRDRGFTPGLWLAPFAVDPKSDVAHSHPDWLVKDDRGKPISAGYVYNKFSHALDTSNPAVLEHLRELMDSVSHLLGFGMVKVDFAYSAALPGRRYNPRLTRAECLRLGLQAVREGVGEDTFLLACGCPFGPSIGVVDAMRIGPDTAPSWEPYINWLPWVGPLISNETSPPSLRNALRHTLNLAVLHQRWWWNDPDCLLVRDQNTHLTEPEVRSAVTLVGLGGGMLISSDDFRLLAPERLRWLSLLVPDLGLHGVPLGLLDRDMPNGILVKVKSNFANYSLIGSFNWSDRPAPCVFDFRQLGYKDGAALDVFDFWHERFIRTNEPEITFPDVPPHGGILLRVVDSQPVPHIVGDTLHISQGAEIASWHFQDGILRIETVDLGRWVSGDLWLSLPREPSAVTCNGDPVEVNSKGDGIFTLRLGFLGRGIVELVL